MNSFDENVQAELRALRRRYNRPWWRLIRWWDNRKNTESSTSSSSPPPPHPKGAGE